MTGSPSADELRALGFFHGATSGVLLSPEEMSTRLSDWRVGWVLAQGFREALEEGNVAELATTVGRLAALYAIDLSDLLDALAFGEEQRDAVRRAFHQADQKPRET